MSSPSFIMICANIREYAYNWRLIHSDQWIICLFSCSVEFRWICHDNFSYKRFFSLFERKETSTQKMNKKVSEGLCLLSIQLKKKNFFIWYYKLTEKWYSVWQRERKPWWWLTHFRSAFNCRCNRFSPSPLDFFFHDNVIPISSFDEDPCQD